MENGEILKKYIGKYNLKAVNYSFNESWNKGGDYLEWLYFKHGEYTYCISCSYPQKFKNKHEYIFSKIDLCYKESFIYCGFSEKKLVKLLKEILNIE